MKHPDFTYVDTAFGGPQNRNHPTSILEVPNLVPDPPVDCYCTWHRFSQDYLHHFESNWKEAKDEERFQSTGGYKGSSYADFLPFDFDSDDLEAVRKMAVEFLAVLEVDYGITEGVRCWFSGSKGFHIALSSELFGGWNPSAALARQLRRLAQTLAKDIPIDGAIYDRNRLWRIPNTINAKTGLWKIPLRPAEVVSFSIDQIVEMAQERRDVSWPSWEDVEPIEAASALWQSIRTRPVKEKSTVIRTDDLFRTDLKEGQGRDTQAFQLACRLRDWGVPSGGALEVLKLWDGQLDVLLTETDGEDILEKKIQSAYGDRADGEDRITPGVLRSLDDLAGDYGAYVESLKTRRIVLGFPGLDRITRGIAPGEVCTVIAKTAVGKTAFVQNVLKHISQGQGVYSVFCSMGQPKAQVFERWAQMATGDPGEDIERGWANEDYQVRVIEKLRSEMGNRVWTCDLPGLKMEEVERLVWMAEAKAGQPIGVLAIDYLGLLDTKNLDRTLYGQVSEGARQMKNLAKKLDLAVILLYQISRSQDDHGDKPLHLSSARESGAIEESADFVIGLYRPYIQRPNGHADDEMVVQLLKNRKGMNGNLICNFDAATLQITERARKDENHRRTKSPPAPTTTAQEDVAELFDTGGTP